MGQLALDKIAEAVDWGTATQLVKVEGFYVFGGRRPNNEASNRLLIIKVQKDKKEDRPLFSIVKPKTIGATPPPRYMHTLDYAAKLGLVVIYGGRNDFLPRNQILSDVWILKLHNLEW